MNVSEMIAVPCEKCGEDTFIHQFGWDKETRAIVLLYTCKRCAYVDWFAIQVEDPPVKGMDDGYL